VALVAVAEVLDHVLGPLVRLGEEHPVWVARVDFGTHALEIVVGLGEVLAVRAVALVEVRHRVEPEAVDAEVEPEPQDVQHRLLHLGVVVVEVGLVGEEAVPVVLAALRVPRPVRRLRVEEDDPRLAPARVIVAPDVPVRARSLRVGTRLLEPRVVGRGVVHDEVRDHADPALVGGLDEGAEVLDVAVVAVDGEEVGDVVTAVAKRRRVHRQQPDAVDPEPLQVVELVHQAAKVAGAVVVAVEEAPDVDLVEDRGLEPQRVSLEPVSGLAHGRKGDVPVPGTGTWPFSTGPCKVQGKCDAGRVGSGHVAVPGTGTWLKRPCLAEVAVMRRF
jgi:hypothetical protein